ncbi:MAG: class I SAM-dependent methyltransferase [Anaerolineae bacterium]|nr:class I SAM-dependent methyltransferase [Anaerolineae bacterium]
MNEHELLKQWEAEAQEPFAGWDFSHLRGRWHEDAPPWSYEALVRATLPGAESLLDMGTGGGEKLLEFRDVFPPRVMATEGYEPNMAVAAANLAPHGVQVIAYDAERDPALPFADDSLDRIINRHEAYDAAEIARVLRPGGLFCTQQVDGRDALDLYSLFGVQPAYLHITLGHLQPDLENAGLIIQAAQDWAGTMTFADVGALVYYLSAIPWNAPPDFSVPRYKDQLLALHARPRLEFTIRRFYLQAVKPKS